MRFPPFIICLLILAMVLVDASVLTLVVGNAGLPSQWPDLLTIALFALCFSQVGLAVIWASLGRQTAPWRLSGAVLVVAAWSATLATMQRGSGPIGSFSTYWAVLLSAKAGVVLVPLLVLRVTGVRLVCESIVDRPEDAPQEKNAGLRPGQFSLGYLLAWILAVAVVLKMLQSLVFYDSLPRQAMAWMEIGILAITTSLLTCFSLWAVMGHTPLVLRVITLCTVTYVVAGPFAQLSGMLAGSLLWLLQTILLTASLATVRVAGYRLERKTASHD